MNNIQFIQINIRYFAFKVEDTYYLLDRKPVNLLCYFFFPLNWLFKQKVYLLTENDYYRLINQNVALGGRTIISSSLIIGCSSIATLFIRQSGLIYQLETDLSRLTNMIFLVFAGIIAFGVTKFIYYSSQKRLEAKLKLEDKKLLFQRIIPKSVTSPLMKSIFLYFMFWLLTAGFVSTTIFSGNLFFLGSSFFMLSFMFVMAGIGYNTQVFYKIVED